MKIAVLIPAFNCENEIAEILRHLDSIIPDHPAIKAVFVIENHSTDKTLQLARYHTKRLQNRKLFSVYQNDRNFGLGGTIKAGMNLCRLPKFNMTHLLVVHGNAVSSAKDIPQMLEFLEKTGRRSVLGYRKKFSLTTRFLILILSLTSSAEIKDLGSDLNVYDLSEFDVDQVLRFSSFESFNVELLFYILKNVKHSWMPISGEGKPRPFDKSYLRYVRAVLAKAFWS